MVAQLAEAIVGVTMKGIDNKLQGKNTRLFPQRTCSNSGLV
jgi:hypothetical protein